MEDAAKRKERLKFLRMEAAQAEVSTSVEISGSLSSLSNPLADDSSLKMEKPSNVSRFDFYTDPMAAFSGSKSSKADTQIKQGASSGSVPWQKHAHPEFYSPPPHFDHNSFNMAPRAIHNQSHLHQQHSPDWSPYRVPVGYPQLPRSSIGAPTQFQVNQGLPYTPNAFGHPGYHPTYASPYDHSFNHGLVSNHWHGKGALHGFQQSSNSSRSVGRGRGFRGSIDQTPGQKRGRGQEFRNWSEAVPPGPERFYKKTMEEDPWQDMEPVLWKSLDPSNAWLPKSIAMGRSRDSEASGMPDSKQSLAEYLATSLEEAISEGSGV